MVIIRNKHMYSLDEINPQVGDVVQYRHPEYPEPGRPRTVVSAETYDSYVDEYTIPDEFDRRIDWHTHRWALISRAGDKDFAGSC